MKIFVLGSTGMLGKYVYHYFQLESQAEVVGISRKELDAAAATEDSIRSLGIQKGDVVINCMGLIKQRVGLTNLDFIRVNSVFPLLLADVCVSIGCKLIHITTDCAFDGLEGNYNEEHEHTAKDVYGISKSLGEPTNATVVRTSIIGEEQGQSRSLVEWVKTQAGKETNGFINHYWNGVTCLQFAKICEEIIDKKLFWKGVRHITSPNSVNKQELVQMISDAYGLDIAVKPFETPVVCDRTMTSIRTDINIVVPELKDQIEEMVGFFDK